MSSASTTLGSRAGEGSAAAHPGARRLPNSVLGMVIFIAAEIMFFAALMSAHTIARATALGGVWPPLNQPRLPVERTAFNTAILLLSGGLLIVARRRFREDDGQQKARPYVAGAIVTGVAFVLLQGVEWVRLLAQGLTMPSSSYGAFFYLIVGAHGLHAVAAIVALAALYFPLRRGMLSPSRFATAQIFWYFVVLLWPIIYLRVYL